MNPASPFQIQVNGRILSLQPAETQLLDTVAVAQNEWHVLDTNSKAHKVKLELADYTAKVFSFKINGNNYTVAIADRYDQLIDKMGLNKVATTRIKEIKAPMPGLVLTIDVEVGQVIKAGDKVLILEAMKMENALKAVGEGTIKKICVQKGEPVVKGQVLIELE